MAEMILPGVYIEVRPEGLIAPGQITVGNVGVVGTASKGIPNLPVLLASYTDAQRTFGTYDPFLNDTGVANPAALTLVRALELVFNFGATTVYAVRVAGSSAGYATKTLKAAAGDCVILTANSPGTWGNGLFVTVAAKQADVFVEDEVVQKSKLSLQPKSVDPDPNKFGPSPRDRVSVEIHGNEIPLEIITDKDPTTQQVKLVKDGTITLNSP